nr:hypothetical protein [Crocosphaera chwakensis]
MHKQFADYRLKGEWFNACEALMNFSDDKNN